MAYRKSKPVRQRRGSFGARISHVRMASASKVQTSIDKVSVPQQVRSRRRSGMRGKERKMSSSSLLERRMDLASGHPTGTSKERPPSSC